MRKWFKNKMIDPYQISELTKVVLEQYPVLMKDEAESIAYSMLQIGWATRELVVNEMCYSLFNFYSEYNLC